MILAKPVIGGIRARCAVSWCTAGAVLCAGVLLISSPVSAEVVGGKKTSSAKAKDACELLTAEEITAQFPQMVLPAPASVPDDEVTGIGKQASGCAWGGSFDSSSRVVPLVRTDLDRKLPKATAKALCKGQNFTDASNRPLTKAELEGIGTAGTLYLTGGQGRITACVGKTRFSVGVAPAGQGEVTLDSVLALARSASKRV